MKKLFLLLIFCILLIGTTTAAEFFQTHGQAETSNAGDTAERGLKFVPNVNLTLRNVTHYTNDASTGASLHYSNGTNIVNATRIGVNSTFNVNLTAGVSYYVCTRAQTTSSWHDPGAFPYNLTYINFTVSVDCAGGFVDQTNVVREFLGVTVEPIEAVGTLTPNTTLISPQDGANQTNNVDLVVASNSTNASTQLVNVSLYLNGVLNETVSITGTGNVTTFSKAVTIDQVQNWTAKTCDAFNCSLFPTNRSFTPKKIYEETISFSSNATEGSSSTFKLNVSVSSGYFISVANLTYNNTNYSSTVTAFNSTLYMVTNSITTPLVSANTNKTFFWYLTLTDATALFSSSNNQTVLNIGLDDCSANNITILNYTLVDEALQTLINGTTQNGTIEVDLSLYPTGSRSVVTASFANTYSNVNNARVCINAELSTSTYDMDVQTRYTATNYANEFHNIQNYTLNASSVHQNITLYALNLTDSTEFLITFKDSSLTPIEDALIHMTRKYVGEGVFKTIEIPITDNNGQTKGHFDTDNVIYTVVVTKNGVTLATFDEVTVQCQNILTAECNLNLNALSSEGGFNNWEETSSLAYDLEFNETGRTITLDFSTLDGSVKTIQFNVTRFDGVGNYSVCNSTLTTSTGSISCSIPLNLGNVTLFTEVFVDGELKVTQIFSIKPNPRDVFGGESYVLAFFLILTIPLLFVSSPIGILIGVILGLFFVILLNVVDTGTWIAPTGTIGWVVITAGILLWKLMSKE